MSMSPQAPADNPEDLVEDYEGIPSSSPRAKDHKRATKPVTRAALVWRRLKRKPDSL